MGQSLLGDELLLYWDIWQRSAPEVVQQVANPIEANPPLFHLLARASQLAGGDPSVMIRVPALIAGTATIPLAYLIGARIAARKAALVASALVSFSSFGVYFSNEARPYALVSFLAGLSTLTLLRAIDQPRPGRWMVYSVTSAALLYTHYTGVFILLAQFCWAVWMHRSLVRGLVLSNVVAGIMFLPWLPTVLRPSDIFLAYGPFVFGTELLEPIRSFALGSPLSGVGFERVPGVAAGALFIGAAFIALVVGIVQMRSRNGKSSDDTQAPVKLSGLLLVLIFATPVGMLVTCEVRGSALFLARNLSASFVGMSIATAVVLTLPKGWIGRATAAVGVFALAWGCTHSFDRSNERTDNRAAAHWIDDHVRRGTVVADQQLPFAGVWPLSPYLRGVTDAGKTRLRDRLNAIFKYPDPTYEQKFAGASSWGGDVAVAFDSIPLLEGMAVVPKRFEGEFRLVKQAKFPGFQGGITVRVFENLNAPSATGRRVLPRR